VIDPAGLYSVKLDQFIQPNFSSAKEYVRHPLAPKEWNDTDFGNDQFLYLLMGSYLRDRDVFDFILLKPNLYKRTRSIDVIAVQNQNWQLLAVSTVAQILINKLPLRWSDDQSRKGFWNVWRFTWSSDSTVSYMTVFVAMIFLSRVGVTWPLRFFDREKYLEKTKAYYATHPNSDWFVSLFEGYFFGKVKP
jgi:hypothetical protein